MFLVEEVPCPRMSRTFNCLLQCYGGSRVVGNSTDGAHIVSMAWPDILLLVSHARTHSHPTGIASCAVQVVRDHVRTCANTHGNFVLRRVTTSAL